MTENNCRDKYHAKYNFLLIEYKELWSYYNNTLIERHKILDYTFRVAVLPVVVCGAILAYYGSKGVTESTKQYIFWPITWLIQKNSSCSDLSLATSIAIISSSLAISFSVIMAGIIAYFMESSNSKIYLISLNKIRDHIRSDIPQLSETLIVDRNIYIKNDKVYTHGKLAIYNDPAFSFSSILTIRGLIPILINSSIGTTIFAITTLTLNYFVISCVFLLFIILHIKIAQIVYNRFLYRRFKACEKKS